MGQKVLIESLRIQFRKYFWKVGKQERTQGKAEGAFGAVSVLFRYKPSFTCQFIEPFESLLSEQTVKREALWDIPIYYVF